MGTTATSTTYRLAPLDSNSAAALRDLGGLTYVADEKPGYPCRHCLRDAEIGEALVLVSHDPFDPEVDTLYRSASPIFLHAERCNAAGDLADLPEQLTVRQLSVRAFDRASMMIDAAAIDGRELDAELHRLFDNPSIQEIHVRSSVTTTTSSRYCVRLASTGRTCRPYRESASMCSSPKWGSAPPF